MQFHSLLIAALTGLSAIAAAPLKRNGLINEPVPGTSIRSGTVLPFDFENDTINGLNSTGELDPGTYIEYYGYYLQPNLGTGPLPGYPVPPNNLTIPDVSSYSSGTTLYLTAVETTVAGACAPGVNPAEYASTTVPLIVA
ncbi:hypothetical protein C8R47DRAFT_1216587 [Mycena vitilis]|nr:hypothetical protein C8R47DRAFT_1216587 [Mycena vitilis]